MLDPMELEMLKLDKADLAHKLRITNKRLVAVSIALWHAKPDSRIFDPENGFFLPEEIEQIRAVAQSKKVDP
jgi:hypothetical protein